MSNCIFSKCIR